MRESEIEIDTEEMAEYLFANLIKRGFVPSRSEVEEISDVVFEYLEELGVFEE